MNTGSENEVLSFTTAGETSYHGTYEEYACTGKMEKGIYGRAFCLSDGRVVIRLEDAFLTVCVFPCREEAEEEYTIY